MALLMPIAVNTHLIRCLVVVRWKTSLSTHCNHATFLASSRQNQAKPSVLEAKFGMFRFPCAGAGLRPANFQNSCWCRGIVPEQASGLPNALRRSRPLACHCLHDWARRNVEKNAATQQS